MSAGILYLGDTSLGSAAAYVAGLISHADWKLDYLPTFSNVEPDLVEAPRRLFILSDFTAACFDHKLQRIMLDHVLGGAGLIMIGGWESFNGESGHWGGTPVSEALPVIIADDDDRVNCDRPTFACAVKDHEVLAGLPWATRPPTIGGYNRFKVKIDAELLLESRTYDAAVDGDRITLTEAGRDPLLAVGEYGKGRMAALATDVAPHWVGPMIDWGERRVSAQSWLPGAIDIEVGDCYAQFVTQLLQWAGRL
ncbi:hypothetical protein HED60_17490 [Planctomycetales bacterium ZRK34]|nr:hypothetical protein HED60_17490 [Planctomycetales bacterium ZRK34]